MSSKKPEKKPNLFQPFFRSLIGHKVIAELKNEVVIKGVLQTCDFYLNLTLVDVEVLNRKAFPQLDPIGDIFIRASSVRYICLPPDGVNVDRLRAQCISYHTKLAEES